MIMWLAGLYFNHIFRNEGTIDLEFSGVFRFTLLYGLQEESKQYDEFDRTERSK